MNHQAHTHDHAASKTPSFWRSRSAIGLVVAGTIAGYLLLKEHWVHAQGYLPYALLLACPLMHLFMHGGHGQHAPTPAEQPDQDKTDVRRQ